MRTELSHIELTGLGGGSSPWRERSAAGYFKSGFAWLAGALIAGLGTWMLMSGYASKPAESEPIHLVAAAGAPAPSTVPATESDAVAEPATLPLEAIAPVEAPAVDGIRIASQSWRRGGLGSNALFTLTLRNSNDYAVRDIEITCAFVRRDGSHLTDRTRVIPDTINGRSRRTFARMHVGFVNVNADKARCALVTASHV